jgi:hypothetical protein
MLMSPSPQSPPVKGGEEKQGIPSGEGYREGGVFSYKNHLVLPCSGKMV